MDNLQIPLPDHIESREHGQTIERAIDWPPQEYRELVEQCVVSYLRKDGRLSLPDGDGPIQELETAYAQWTGTKYALACNSGTSAIHSAYVAIGLETGDEVLVPAYTFHASVTPLLHIGAKPVLCELEPFTGNLDPKDAAQRITSRTRAIMVTHIYGYPANMDAIMMLAKQHSLKVIEDCSHAHGATFKGKSVGSIGDVGVFSLQENKLAPAGEGGILVTSSLEIFERAVMVGHFNGRAFRLTTSSLRHLAETGFGLKYRIHPLAALAGLAGIEIARRYGQQRRIHAYKVSTGLACTKTVALLYDPEAAYFAFRLQYHSDAMPADAFVALARQKGLDIRRASLPPLFALPLFKEGADALNRQIAAVWPTYCAEDFPVTRAYVDRLLGMPFYWHPSHRNMRDTFINALVTLTQENNLE